MHFSGYIHLAAGLSCGMTGLAAGHAIGMIGDAVRITSASIEYPLMLTGSLFERSCSKVECLWVWY